MRRVYYQFKWERAEFFLLPPLALPLQICPTSVHVVCWGIFGCRSSAKHLTTFGLFGIALSKNKKEKKGKKENIQNIVHFSLHSLVLSSRRKTRALFKKHVRGKADQKKSKRNRQAFFSLERKEYESSLLCSLFVMFANQADPDGRPPGHRKIKRRKHPCASHSPV